MLKKTMLAAIFLASLMFAANTAAEQNNLVKNPGFEEAESRKPVFWKTYSFDTSGITEFKVESGTVRSGENSLAIINKKPNDSKAEQKISVEKGRTYRIGCWIRTDSIKQQAGSANITLLQEEAIYTSTEYMDTGGQWRKLEFCIRALEDRKPEFTLILRLGGQGTVNSGTAFFDEVYVIPIDEPEKVNTVSFYIPDSSSQVSHSNNTAGTPRTSETNEGRGNLWLIAVGIVVLAAIIFIELKFSKNRNKGNEQKKESAGSGMDSHDESGQQ